MANNMQSMAMMLSLISFVSAFVPFLVALAWWVMWWKALARPGFFLLTAVLSMVGLHQILHFLVRMLSQVLLAVMPGLRDSEDIVAANIQLHLIHAVAAGVLTIILGSLLMLAARRRVSHG
jgi:hypothetical protein